MSAEHRYTVIFSHSLDAVVWEDGVGKQGNTLRSLSVAVAREKSEHKPVSNSERRAGLSDEERTLPGMVRREAYLAQRT